MKNGRASGRLDIFNPLQARVAHRPDSTKFARTIWIWAWQALSWCRSKSAGSLSISATKQILRSPDTISSFKTNILQNPKLVPSTTCRTHEEESKPSPQRTLITIVRNTKKRSILNRNAAMCSCNDVMYVMSRFSWLSCSEILHCYSSVLSTWGSAMTWCVWHHDSHDCHVTFYVTWHWDVKLLIMMYYREP